MLCLEIRNSYSIPISLYIYPAAGWHYQCQSCVSTKCMACSFSSIEFPEEWLPFENEEKLKVVSLRLGTSEYNSIAELFLSSLGIQNVAIFNIQRIQNVYLWTDFISRRNAILERQGGYCREEYVFHGTGSVDPKKIYSGHKSFDVVQSAQGQYGRGNYFAKDAMLSHQGYVYCQGNML